LPELRTVGHTAALGLVQVLAGDDVAVLRGIRAERPQLGGDGQVHVLAVAGAPRIEGHQSVVRFSRHGHVSPFSLISPASRSSVTGRPTSQSRPDCPSPLLPNLPPIVRHGVVRVAGFC